MESKIGILCTAEIEHFDIAHACTLKDIKEIVEEYMKHNSTITDCVELKTYVNIWHDERIFKHERATH